MRAHRPLVLDLATIFGRLIASLRDELKMSQADLSEVLGWERSLLARIETGRNTASIDNIVELEEAFFQRNLIGRRGDLLELTCQIVLELQRRGHRAVYGNQPKPAGEAPIDAPELDRVVVRVVDEWLTTLKRGRGATTPATNR